MNINQSINQFIGNYQEKNLQFKEIVENEIEVNPHQISESIEVQSQEVEEIFASFDKEIEDKLQELPPDTPPEEKLNEVIRILQRESKTIQDQIKTKVKAGEKGEEVNHYLTQPILALSLGIHIAEKLESYLPVKLDEEMIERSLFAADQSEFGLDVIGLGFRCYAVQNESKQIRGKIEERESLIQLAQKESDPAKLKEYDAQIEAIDHEIDQMKEKFNSKISEVTKKFLTTAFSESSNVLDFVANSDLIELHTNVIEKLLIASSDLSLAGSLVSLGWNCYQVGSHASHLSHTKNKISELQSLAKTFGPDEVYLHYIVQAKLDRLANVKKDYQYQLGSKVANMCASTLALAAATNTAIAATTGIALGATASLLLTTAGGAGAVLVGGTVVTGLGVAAYQNRYEIEHAAKSIPVVSQKLIVKAQLEMAKKTNQQIKAKMKQLETEQSEVQNRLQALQNAPAPKGKNIVAQMQAAEVENKKAFQKMNAVMTEMNETLDVQKECLSQIKNLEKELKALDKRKVVLSEDKKMKNFRKKFRVYDTPTLEVIKRTIQEGLSKPQAKEQIRDFLNSQKFPAHQDLSVETVLDYLISPK